MRGEIDLFGVYVPPLLFIAVFAWLLLVVLSRLLNRIGAYRIVWHRPLFNVALYVIVLAGCVFGLARLLTVLIGVGA
jgi:hypothetical protein